jgi:hypothetical protein
MRHDVDCTHVALSLPDDCNQCGVVEKVRLRERDRIVNLIESLDNRVTMVQKGWLLDTIVEMINARHEGV